MRGLSPECVDVGVKVHPPLHTYQEHCGLLASEQVPHPRRLVPAASGQQLPVRAEGDAVDPVGVALWGGGRGILEIVHRPERPHSVGCL